MKTKILFYILIITFSSCNVNKQINHNNYDILIFKFLYNIDYSYPQTEKSFWINGEDESEFAIYKYKGLHEEKLLEFIYSQKLAEPENDSNNIFLYNFAFVFPNKDTIYSNNRLDQWKVKRNGKVEYYSGPDINTPVEKTELCNFFSLNNFFSETIYTKFPIEDLKKN